MIHRLRMEERRRALPVFRELDYNLQITSIIEGVSRGEVYVDDPLDPQTAFIWNGSSKFYLAGDTDNARFNVSLNRLIIEEIYPEARRRKIWGWVLHFHPEGWEERIGDILKETRPMKDDRRYYTLGSVKIDWKREKPADVQVIPADKVLLDMPDLGHVDDVIKELRGTWGSVENFLKHGFGFCLIHDDDVASWCLSEYNSGDRCEIGIETFEEYRRRGYAALTASAFLEHCVARGIAPGWHCWESNKPSWMLAEKIGFESPLTYPIYFDWFDERDSLIVNAGWSLDHLNRPKEAADYYEQAFSIGDVRAIYYYKAARAWARVGEADCSIQNLEKAVERGWSDMGRMLVDEDFKCLHGEDAWIDLVKTLNEPEK